MRVSGRRVRRFPRLLGLIPEAGYSYLAAMPFGVVTDSDGYF